MCSDHPEGVAPSEFPLAVHGCPMTYFGLQVIDNCDLEAVADAAASRKRYEFMFAVAPLRIRGGTGSHVNPIATF